MYFVPYMVPTCIALVKVKYSIRCNTIYVSAIHDLHLDDSDDYIKELWIGNEKWITKNKLVKSKFSECPDFSCSRSDGTLEPCSSQA